MSDKRALIMGLNTYASPHLPDLEGAVPDAAAMAELLRRNHDFSPNYECSVLLDQMEDGKPITRAALRAACEELFFDYTGDVLLYYSGHGVKTAVGGYITAYDSSVGDWGIPMQEIMALAANSKARHKVLILDCCHAGDMGNLALFNGRGGDLLAALGENMTVMAAARPAQASVETNGHGLFTAAILDALEGGAADHMGLVTAPAIYAYAERRFGPLAQRPMYKTHANTVPIIRQCAPLIERHKLYRLIEFFPSQTYQYQLDPEYEPDDEHGNRHEPVNEEKVAIAELFKEYRDAGLLKPSTPGEQLYWTARRSHTVQLTARGQEYWYLIAEGKI